MSDRLDTLRTPPLGEGSVTLSREQAVKLQALLAEHGELSLAPAASPPTGVVVRFADGRRVLLP